MYAGRAARFSRCRAVSAMRLDTRPVNSIRFSSCGHLSTNSTSAGVLRSRSIENDIEKLYRYYYFGNKTASKSNRYEKIRGNLVFLFSFFFFYD